MVEREEFEPSIVLPLYTLSKRLIKIRKYYWNPLLDAFEPIYYDGDPFIVLPEYKKKIIQLINIYTPNGNPVDTDKYTYKK